MKRKNTTSFAAGIAAMVTASNLLGYGGISKWEPKPAKNKYNLTDEELELMAKMAPKEKKRFLRDRVTPVEQQVKAADEKS